MISSCLRDNIVNSSKKIFAHLTCDMRCKVLLCVDVLACSVQKSDVIAGAMSLSGGLQTA